MDRFAFIAHPLAVGQIKTVFPFIKLMPNKMLEKTLKYYPPLVFQELDIDIGTEPINGLLVACPLLPIQFKNLAEEQVNKIILKSINYSEKKGVKLIGLGAYTSIVGDKGITLANKSTVPLTTGNSYTVWVVVQACLGMAKKKNIDLASSNVCIIGATGTIGFACAEMFASLANKLTLCAPNVDELKILAKSLCNEYSAKIDLKIDPKAAVENADLVVAATSSPTPLMRTSDLKPNSIVCDVAMPPNVYFDGSKGNSAYIKGGLVQIPSKMEIALDKYIPGLETNVVFACLAETILLTLEKRFENFSLGKRLSLNSIHEIGKISTKYGFKPYLKNTTKSFQVSNHRHN